MSTSHDDQSTNARDWDSSTDWDRTSDDAGADTQTTVETSQDAVNGTSGDNGFFGEAVAQPQPLPRPSGPSWGTIALGLICLLVAGGALFVEFTDLSLDWERMGPLSVVGLGVVLVLVGLAALLRRNDDEGLEG